MGDESPGDRGWTDDLDHCGHCGAKLPKEEWCPVARVTDDDGTTRVLSFCDESCKASRMADAPETGPDE